MRRFLAVILSALLFVACKETGSPKVTNDPVLAKDTTMGTLPTTDIYKDLRAAAGNTKHTDLNITLPADRTVVYGVLMDWGMPEGVATVTCFQTGDASMYTSTGGGTIGGIGYEKVSSSAKQVVEHSQTYLDRAIKIDSMPLPQSDNVFFYLLTNNGKYVLKESTVKFEDESSPILPLFALINDVITAFREVEEARSK